MDCEIEAGHGIDCRRSAAAGLQCDETEFSEGNDLPGPAAVGHLTKVVVGDFDHGLEAAVGAPAQDLRTDLLLRQ